MMEAAAGEARIFEDAEALARNAAEWLCGLALAGDRQFAICCSGGSTPKRLYEVLAEPATAARFPWNRVHWFWGDERFVPHDHPDSNYRMVREALLSRVAVPERNVHAVPTAGVSPEQAAAAYERTLQAFYGADHAQPGAAALRRDAVGNWRGRPHRLAVPGPSGAGGGNPLGACGHRRQGRGAHHLDLSGTRQQRRRRLPGDRKKQAGAGRARPIRRSRAAGGADSTGRPSALVHRSGRGLGAVTWNRPAGRNKEATDVRARRAEQGRAVPPLPSVVIVMGVSGSGKSTIGSLLAGRLQWEFEDGDWFHPAANVEKMHSGIPLTDEDRWPWLHSIKAWIDKTQREGGHGVIACSVLKRRYRDAPDRRSRPDPTGLSQGKRRAHCAAHRHPA